MVAVAIGKEEGIDGRSVGELLNALHIEDQRKVGIRDDS